MPHGGERGLNGVRGPQMNPVFRWEVIERQQLPPVLGQAVRSLGILCLVGLQKQIECYGLPGQGQEATAGVL